MDAIVAGDSIDLDRLSGGGKSAFLYGRGSVRLHNTASQQWAAVRLEVYRLSSSRFENQLLPAQQGMGRHFCASPSSNREL